MPRFKLFKDAREKGEASNLMDKEGPEVLYALLGALRGDCPGHGRNPEGRWANHLEPVGRRTALKQESDIYDRWEMPL